MIVCIPSLATGAISGKTHFCKRLAKALSSLNDVEVTSDLHRTHDISLHAVSIQETRVKARRVLRLDGVWHNTAQDFLAQNEEIRRDMEKADAVVYQSQFSKRIADKYLSPYQGPWEVIFNGADPSFYRSFRPLPKTHEHAFVAHSRWRPHKRLLEVIRSFLLAKIQDSCLYIAGDLSGCGIHPDLLRRCFSAPNIRYLGTLDQEHLAQLLNTCDASIHLCWIDSCPNSVVEAIAAGRPVVTNNVGGTQELVGPSGGFVCAIDEPWDLNPCNLYSPPPIDRAVVAEALRQCAFTPPRISWDHVDIRNIALQYKRFFERVLG